MSVVLGAICHSNGVAPVAYNASAVRSALAADMVARFSQCFRETSAVMLAYLDEACKRRRRAGRLRTLEDLVETVHQGAVERIRPMAMAGLANILGLIPVMWATGTGADVMKRLAASMVGGVLSAMILTLFVIPAVYVMWRWWKEQPVLDQRAAFGAASTTRANEILGIDGAESSSSRD